MGNWRLGLGWKYEGSVLTGLDLLNSIMKMDIHGYIDYLLDVTSPSIVA